MAECIVTVTVTRAVGLISSQAVASDRDIASNEAGTRHKKRHERSAAKPPIACMTTGLRVVGGSSNTQLGLISAKSVPLSCPPGAILWRAGVKVSTCGVGVRNYPYSLRHTVARPVQWIARKMDIPNSIGNQPSVPLAS